MIKKISYCLIIIFSVSVSFGFDKGEKVKLFELRDIDGNMTYLKNYCGDKPKFQVIILDFFSTSCAPCIKALEFLKKAKDDYKDVEVFLISFKEREGSLRRFFEGKEIPLKILMDKYGDEAKNYGVVGLPHTIFIDRNCVWRESIIGEVSDYEKVLKEKIEKTRQKGGNNSPSSTEFR